MRVTSILYDHRIAAHNVLFEFNVGEYLEAVRSVLDANEFQRKKLSGSKSVYSLLKGDIERGCVIPPIVLALSNFDLEITVDEQNAVDLVSKHTTNLLILDGLQRTYTLLDLERELSGEARLKLLGQPLRVEVYIGINRLGILYRMLTLNTGQSPMSLRQQVEMLYSDYSKIGLLDIKFVREVDEEHATAANELNFKDTLDGFNSYLERNELPLERADILESIKGLESLSQENSSKDLFKEFTAAWVVFLRKTEELCSGIELTVDDAKEGLAVWGRTPSHVFKRSQAITGFGSAVGKLKENQSLNNLDDVVTLVPALSFGAASPREFLLTVNTGIKWINTTTKKIGNAQRMYFDLFFRELLRKNNDTYLDMHASAVSALHIVKAKLG